LFGRRRGGPRGRPVGIAGRLIGRSRGVRRWSPLLRHSRRRLHGRPLDAIVFSDGVLRDRVLRDLVLRDGAVLRDGDGLRGAGVLADIHAQHRQRRRSGLRLRRENRLGLHVPARQTGDFLMRGAKQRRRAEAEDHHRHRHYNRDKQETETGQHEIRIPPSIRRLRCLEVAMARKPSGTRRLTQNHLLRRLAATAKSLRIRMNSE
jgi:hypothetical protein